jgi:hypothetical protein
MNDTWWDDLDNVICQPGHVEAEFVSRCLLLTRILPSSMMITGICLVYIAWQLLKISPPPRKVDTPATSIPTGERKQATPIKALSHAKRTARANGAKSRRGIFAAAFAVNTLSIGLTYLVDGHGLMYRSNTFRSLLGAGFCK